MQKITTFNRYLKNLFGRKVYKVSIDAGFTCPNIDGTKAKGGCIFCDEYGSSSRVHENRSIKEQVLNNIKIRKTRYKAKKFIAYFQSFSNTYKNIDELKKLYNEALCSHPDIVGLSISTRADCLDENKVKLVASYRKFLPYVSIELGLQSMHDKTLKKINRQETLKDFIKAYTLIKKYNLHLCVHVILGLPQETDLDMMRTANFLSSLKIDGVKIHILVALKNTVLEKLYLKKLWTPLSYERYLKIASYFIKTLGNSCIIHSSAASGYAKDIIAPSWLYKKKLKLIEDINQRL